MKTVIFFLLLVAALGPATLTAQDAADIHGSITGAYRFTDIKGREEKYKELFDLRSGFRIQDLSLYSGEGQKNRYFDSFFLTSSGMGGEPFSGGQFVIKKNKVYDLRVNYQQSYYYWNRNDLQPQPTGLLSSNIPVHGLMTNHDWSTVRKIGSVNLATYATTKLRFNFEYQQTSLEGQNATTRVLDYFGAPSTWGSFERADPYGVESSLNNHSHRATAGVSYSIRNWSFFYRAGYQWFDEDTPLQNMTSNERSINIDDTTAPKELLTQATWSNTRSLRTPVSEFSYNGRLSDRIRMRGGYTYYRFHGPFLDDGSFSGFARTTGTNVAPYSVTFHNQGSSAENSHVIDQGFTFEATPQFNIHTDYRYYRYDIDSNASYVGSTNGAAPTAGVNAWQWFQGTHTLDVALEFLPGRKIQLKPGIRLMKRDVTTTAPVDPFATKRSKIASPILTVYYSPSSKITLRGDIQNTTNGTPYTRISPRTDFNVRFVGRYQATSRISIEENLHTRTGEFSTSNFRSSIRSNSTNVGYRLNDKLSLLGGFTYDSFLATDSVTFLRGTPPLTATWRDQTVNRIWQAGFQAKPTKKLTLDFSGNYLRTTGVGEISGEPPTEGPMRWPYATGTAAYEFPHVGRLSIDLQRTYYIEEILKGDNFGANLLTIRWTREF
jgi:hypothetical protein